MQIISSDSKLYGCLSYISSFCTFTIIPESADIDKLSAIKGIKYSNNRVEKYVDKELDQIEKSCVSNLNKLVCCIMIKKIIDVEDLSEIVISPELVKELEIESGSNSDIKKSREEFGKILEQTVNKYKNGEGISIILDRTELCSIKNKNNISISEGYKILLK